MSKTSLKSLVGVLCVALLGTFWIGSRQMLNLHLRNVELEQVNADWQVAAFPAMLAIKDRGAVLDPTIGGWTPNDLKEALNPCVHVGKDVETPECQNARDFYGYNMIRIKVVLARTH